jgi:hypothetical protein
MSVTQSALIGVRHSSIKKHGVRARTGRPSSCSTSWKDRERCTRTGTNAGTFLQVDVLMRHRFASQGVRPFLDGGAGLQLPVSYEGTINVGRGVYRYARDTPSRGEPVYEASTSRDLDPWVTVKPLLHAGVGTEWNALTVRVGGAGGLEKLLTTFNSPGPGTAEIFVSTAYTFRYGTRRKSTATPGRGVL